MFNLYAIYDRITVQYSEPRTFINDGSAVRWFNGVMKESKFQASDFELYCIGSYNVDLGVISAFEKPLFVVRGEVDNGKAVSL